MPNFSKVGCGYRVLKLAQAYIKIWCVSVTNLVGFHVESDYKEPIVHKIITIKCDMMMWYVAPVLK